MLTFTPMELSSAARIKPTPVNESQPAEGYIKNISRVFYGQKRPTWKQALVNIRIVCGITEINVTIPFCESGKFDFGDPVYIHCLPNGTYRVEHADSELASRVSPVVAESADVKEAIEVKASAVTAPARLSEYRRMQLENRELGKRLGFTSKRWLKLGHRNVGKASVRELNALLLDLLRVRISSDSVMSLLP